MRGTPEGRRLFASCLGAGLGLGLVAGIGAALLFHSSADYVPCHFESPQVFRTCPELDLVGFELRSSVQAALTVGSVVALIGWVLSVVTVLYSSHHHPDEFGRHG